MIYTLTGESASYGGDAAGIANKILGLQYRF
ncbi:protease VII (Omptin) precursor|nr:protease VII (Omptin) precursor [Candidatus Pantoea persica]